MIDKTIVRDVYKKASSKQAYLSTSRFSDKKIFSLSIKFNLDEEQHSTLARTVCHIILGFYKVEDTVPLLQQELKIDAKTAALLGAEVIDFLAPLSDPQWVPPVAVADEDGAEEVAEADTAPAAALILPVKQASTPVLAPALEPAPTPSQLAELAAPVVLHTFAGDLATVRHDPPPSYQPSPALTEPTYSSSQPVLRSSLSSIPNYAPLSEPAIKPVSEQVLPDRPKWSSEG